MAANKGQAAEEVKGAYASIDERGANGVQLKVLFKNVYKILSDGKDIEAEEESTEDLGPSKSKAK